MSDVGRRKLCRLQEELAFLQGQAGVTRRAWSGDPVLRRAVERALQTAIEACLDLGRHLVVAAQWGMPATGRDVANALEAHAVLTAAQAQHLREMVGFRNILVHEYEAVDADVVWTVLTRRLEDLRQIGEALGRATEARGA